MKGDDAIALAKKLRAEGVRRVELDGDEVKAIEFADVSPDFMGGGAGGGEGASASAEDDKREREGFGLDDDLDVEKDPSTSPFVQALAQVQDGKFRARARGEKGN